MFSVRSTITALVMGLAALSPFAQSVPATINYQGRLTDNSPTPVPVNTTVNMQFSIWDDPTAGNQLWQHSLLGPQPVVVTNGIFNVLLGGGGLPIPATVFSTGTARYLEINAGGETLTPRQIISATGYANQAENAALAANATLADTAADSTQLGGVAAAGYQLATVQSCAGQSFVKTIANGSATCALPQANNLTAPVTLGAPLASPTAVLSSSNSSNGPGISAASTTGIGVTVTAGGTDGVLATNTAAGGNGLHGIANNGGSAYGVWGESSSGFAGYFSGKVNITGKATSAATLAGDAATTLVTKGYVDSGAGVPNPLALSGNSLGAILSGTNTGMGSGVSGSAASGTGIYGSGQIGVSGISTSTDSYGVIGTANSGSNAVGVWGKSTFGYAGLFTGRLGVSSTTTLGADVFINLAHINFGSATRQMINLWGVPDGSDTAGYGIGVQAATEYFRAGGGGGFAWFSGGTHSDTQNDPGAGGTKLMAVDASGNLSQPQPAAGAVKAMAYITASALILRCYNGGLASGPTTTPPCGMSVIHSASPGYYTVDFGFQIDNRFASVTGSQVSRSFGCFNVSANQQEVDVVNSSSGISVDTAFTIFIY